LTFGENDELVQPVKRFRVGLVFKAHRILYHSTLGLRVIEKKKTLRAGSLCVARVLLAQALVLLQRLGVTYMTVGTY